MQNASARRRSIIISPPRQIDDAILHFELADLLSPGQILALNTRLGTLALLAHGDTFSHPELLAEQQFNSSEMSALLPLLQNHPHYCSYEVMLASVNTGNTSEASIEHYRQRLQEAQGPGAWDYELRPVRNILSRTRFKLREFGIEISSILETGYLLIALPTRKMRREMEI